MSKFQLYYFPLCPYCRYVLSNIKSMPVDVEMKDIMKNNDFRNELMEGGGKTQVPCLRIEHEDSVEWMYESSDIVQYLARHSSESTVD